jgi:hypothetical protein
MEPNNNRRLLVLVGLVLLFVVVVLVWYFSYAKPIIAPSMNTTNDPVPKRTFPPRFQFLNWGSDTVSTSTTEVTDPLKDPLVKVWDKPATGQTGNILKKHCWLIEKKNLHLHSLQSINLYNKHIIKKYNKKNRYKNLKG